MSGEVGLGSGGRLSARNRGQRRRLGLGGRSCLEHAHGGPRDRRDKLFEVSIPESRTSCRPLLVEVPLTLGDGMAVEVSEGSARGGKQTRRNGYIQHVRMLRQISRLPADDVGDRFLRSFKSTLHSKGFKNKEFWTIIKDERLGLITLEESASEEGVSQKEADEVRSPVL